MRYAALFLISSTLAVGGVVTTATINTAVCQEQHSAAGEFNVGVVAGCGGSGAGAASAFDGVYLFTLTAYANKVSGSGLGDVTATSLLEAPLLVTGTDQPGFLRVSLVAISSLSIIGPSILQTTSVTAQGVNYFASSPPQFLYIPYIAGVPSLLSVQGRATAGALDVDFPGNASLELRVYITPFILSEVPTLVNGVETPFHPIPGASWRIVPEPGTWALLAGGLGFVGLRRIRRVNTRAVERTPIRRP